MCRALRRQHPQMAPSQKNCYSAADASYVDRLNSLKQVLKPYRDNNANCLRAITRSARVNLNKHWKSLENLFAADRCDEERAQNATNEKLEKANGENAKSALHRHHRTTASDAVEKKLRNMRVDR